MKRFQTLLSISTCAATARARASLPKEAPRTFLREGDIGAHLQGAMVEVLWGGDGVWYRGEMHEVNMASGASIMYPDTGETEEVGPWDNTVSERETETLSRV